MTNSKQEYNDFVRANLPGSIRYDSVRNRYVTANNKYFVTYKEAKWYVDYLVKRGSNLAYAEGGYTPSTILDYSGQKSYVGGNLTSSFSDVVTATRTGLATQLDASGNRVWNAHNLLRYSEQFDDAAWAKGATTVSANQVAAPDGTTTGDRIEADGTSSEHYVIQTAISGPSGVNYAYRVWLKPDQYRYVALVSSDGAGTGRWVAALFDLSGSGSVVKTGQGAAGTHVSSSVIGVEDGWYYCELVASDDFGRGFQLIPSLTDNPTFGNYGRFTEASTLGDGFFAWGAHLYRSDLGGMAPVPLTRRVAGSTTYVPTTSAAVYLPREEAYTYVSGSLVGPYYQKESDARTNLVTYSEDFTDASWAKVNAGVGSVPVVTANQGISPSGETTADRVQFDLNGGTTAGDVSRLRFSSTTVAASTGSFWVKSFDGTPYTIGFNVGSTLLAVSVTSEWQRVNATFSSSGATAVDIQLRGAQTPTNSDTADILLWGAQHEEGSTPTSYIPTSGSTVTRSADSTTIAAGNMPYPTPQVIGPELVTNGTFDTDVSGWNVSASATAVYNSGKADVERTGSYSILFDQQLGLSQGKVYLITYTISNLVGVVFSAYGATANSSTVNEIGGQRISDGTYTDTFVSPIDNPYIGFATGTGDSFTVDNISVREINPLALSFQMEGLVTYADENNATNALYYQWLLDGNNRIDARLYTAGTHTGGLQILQAASGVLEQIIQASPGSYSPGINVPFNISSRHGSTFVNGAVDGTALTADLTPTALPDLSATTFDLAPTFNGFIKEFRVWADDIGDSGIAEAST